MKICIICSSVIPNGGTERAISIASKIFKSVDNIETNILSLCSSENDIPAFEYKCPITHLNLEPLKEKITDKVFWYLKAIRRLKKYIKSGNYDCIIAYGHNISIMLPFIRSKNEKIFAYEHINFDTIPALFHKIITYVYPYLDGVIVLSEIAKRKLTATNTNIIIIPNSIPFNSSVEIPNIQTFNNRIIMVGRVSPEKGYERIIPIAKILKSRFPNWTLNIYGDGPDLPKIKEDLEKEDLTGYIICHGQVKDIQNEYPKGDILMLTSYTEALPMVIIEANYFGLPVVAYENEGTQTLIDDGKNGYIINDNDVNSFVDRLENLITNFQEYKVMSDNARLSASNYTIDKVRSKWLQFISINSK